MLSEDAIHRVLECRERIAGRKAKFSLRLVTRGVPEVTGELEVLPRDHWTYTHADSSLPSQARHPRQERPRDLRHRQQGCIPTRDAGEHGIEVHKRHVPGNMPFMDFYAMLARITGRDAPLLAMPQVTRTLLSWMPRLGRERGIGVGVGPVISREDLELSSHFWYASSDKAKAELGFSPRDPLATLEDTVDSILTQQAQSFARFRSS